MQQNIYYVYILTNKNKAVLYIGVTDALKRRVYEHKEKLNKGFSSKYNVDQLIYFEIFTDIKKLLQGKAVERMEKRMEGEFDQPV
jgi:putative endonuclease